MLVVSQNWLEAQQSQLRPESDIKIEFYEINAIGGLSYITEINKTHISTFNYHASGKIENVNTPSYEINLNLIKGTYSEIQRGYVAKLFFGMFVNNAWEYVEADYFKVTEISIPANGLVDKFVLKAVSDDLLSQKYIKGSNGGNLDPIKFLNKVYGRTPVSASNDLASFNNVLIGMSLGECSKFEALQVLAIACGKTLFVNKVATVLILDTPVVVGYSDLKFKSIAPDNSNVNYNYIISPSNSYSFPETKKSNSIGNLVIDQYTNVKITDPVARKFNEVFTDYRTIGSWTKQFEVIYHSISFAVMAGSFISQSVQMDGYTASWYAVKQTNVARTEISIYEMETTAEQYTYNIGSGEDFYVDNELINENYITPASDYLRLWLPYQDYIECEFRIDPRLELFDKIIVFDKSQNSHIVIVEEITIDFNGSFSGKIRGRKLVDETSVLDPMVRVTDYAPNTFSFRIVNFNPFPCEVTIAYSNVYQPYRFTIPANSTLICNRDNCPLLRASFEAYAIGELYDYVTCRFNSDYGMSNSEIILEANY